MQPTDMQLAGEPDTGDDVTVEDALLFAADLVGKLDYVLTTKPVIGFAS